MNSTKKTPAPETDWTAKERRFLNRLKTPARLQSFLDEIPYHVADTAWSPRTVMHEGQAHCLEGAVFAAAALRFHGGRAWILDLEAERDTDHVICVYQAQGLWGSIGTSNYSGCRGRKPVYRSLRELALSYFEDYFNLRGEHTLRTFSKPVDLARFDRKGWQTTTEPIWYIPEYLLTIPHTPLFSPKEKRTVLPKIGRVTPGIFAAGTLGRRD